MAIIHPCFYPQLSYSKHYYFVIIILLLLFQILIEGSAQEEHSGNYFSLVQTSRFNSLSKIQKESVRLMFPSSLSLRVPDEASFRAHYLLNY